MTGDTASVTKLFRDGLQYVVPVFQRPYVWTQERQWEPLWCEIEEIALSGSNRDYFLGAIVVQPQLSENSMRAEQCEVIDGQQRLTTLQILLAAMRNLAKDFGFSTFLGRLNDLTINRNVNGNDIQKLWPTDADQMVYGLVVHPDKQSEIHAQYPKRTRGRRQEPRPLLVEAYEYFEGEVREYLERDVDNRALSKEESYARMESLLNVVKSGIKVVSISLAEHDDPQIIFESLNGRPTPLLASDLIKNFVLRKSPNRESLYSRYWKSFDIEGDSNKQYWRSEEKQGRLKKPRLDLFLMHYLQFRRGREIIASDLFREFQQWWSAELDNKKSAESLFEEIVAYAAEYRRMVSPTNDTDPENTFFRNLKSMDISLVYPLMFLILKEGQDQFKDWVVKDDVPGMLQDIESYLVRRHVCDLSKKKYNYVFPTVLRKLREHVHSGGQIDRACLRRILCESNADSIRWPNNQDFKQAWMDSPLYDYSPRAFINVILERIDRTYPRDLIAFVNYGKATIEHVLPQGWQTHWPLPQDAQGAQYGAKLETPEETRERLLHSIGNLTLLGQELNAGVSNAPYALKREAIVEQNSLRINSYFRNVAQWDEAAIRTRSEMLFAVALELWPRPDDTEDFERPAAPRVEAKLDCAGRGTPRYENDSAAKGSESEFGTPTPSNVVAAPAVLKPKQELKAIAVEYVAEGLYGSSRPAYPKTGEAISTIDVEAWIAYIKGKGIKSVICLLDVAQLGYYRHAGGLLEAYRRAGLSVRHVPAADYQNPPLTDAQLQDVKNAYEELPKPVVIHCSAGIDRTGAAVEHLTAEEPNGGGNDAGDDAFYRAFIRGEWKLVFRFQDGDGEFKSHRVLYGVGPAIIRWFEENEAATPNGTEMVRALNRVKTDGDLIPEYASRHWLNWLSVLGVLRKNGNRYHLIYRIPEEKLRTRFDSLPEE